MSLIEEAGSMPPISYWIWGAIGLLIFLWSYYTFKITDKDTGQTTYFWENLIGILIGFFLIYYWLNKIGIVPMCPWQLNNWFYGWRT